MLSEDELESLLCGQRDVNVADLRAHTQYTQGYSEDSPTVQLFWQVLQGWEPERRLDLLQFVTGSRRVPTSGFAQLEPAFTVQRVRRPRTGHVCNTRAACSRGRRLTGGHVGAPAVGVHVLQPA